VPVLRIAAVVSNENLVAVAIGVPVGLLAGAGVLLAAAGVLLAGLLSQLPAVLAIRRVFVWPESGCRPSSV
jgi:uncharacterized membrane protein (DUF441 family)